MSTRDATKYLGKMAQLDVSGLTFLVQIVDVRQRYGQTDFLITPDSGHGRAWKSSTSVRTN